MLGPAALARPGGDGAARCGRQWDLLLGRSTSSLLCVPVADAGAAHDAAGVVLLTNKEGSAAFTEADRVVACILARQMWSLHARHRHHHAGGGGGGGAADAAASVGLRLLHSTAAVARGVTRFKQGGRRRSSIVSSLFNEA